MQQLIQHSRESEEVFTPSDVSSAPWSPLVPIQPLGARTPLFCVHPLGGEVLCYYQLARQLGTDQPVYGLQARPLDGQAEAPRVTIEETAAEYVDAVRSFQPAGPTFWLGTHSAGSSRSRWRDSSPASERRWRCSPSLISRFLWATKPRKSTPRPSSPIFCGIARGHGRTLKLDAETLRGLPLDNQLARYLEILESMEAVGPGFDIPLLRGLALGWSSRATAVERYKVSTYPGRITLLRASSVDAVALQELTPQRRQIFEDPTLGWGTVAAGGVEVHTVPGSHQTIIEAPHVETLAEILGMCIAQAERERGRTDSLWGSPLGTAASVIPSLGRGVSWGIASLVFSFSFEMCIITISLLGFGYKPSTVQIPYGLGSDFEGFLEHTDGFSAFDTFFDHLGRLPSGACPRACRQAGVHVPRGG